MTPAQRERFENAIRTAWETGLTSTLLAERFGVARDTVSSTARALGVTLPKKTDVEPSTHDVNALRARMGGGKAAKQAWSRGLPAPRKGGT